jgi:hypothetical protein
MLRCAYMFETDGTSACGAEQKISTMASRAIEAGINERPGIRYQELTDPSNPKPVFAVLFAEAGQQTLFETLFEPALKLCGLRVSALRGLPDRAPENVPAETPCEAHKAELGYIDRDHGFALFIPSVRGPIEET